MKAIKGTEKPCWWCGELVRPNKQKHFKDGDENAVVHKGTCYQLMLQSTDYEKEDFR